MPFCCFVYLFLCGNDTKKVPLWKKYGTCKIWNIDTYTVDTYIYVDTYTVDSYRYILCIYTVDTLYYIQSRYI